MNVQRKHKRGINCNTNLLRLALTVWCYKLGIRDYYHLSGVI